MSSDDVLPCDAAHSAETPAPAEQPAAVVCRRCGKGAPIDSVRCPYCEARLPVLAAFPAAVSQPPPAQLDSREPEVAITRMLVFFSALLITNLTAAWIWMAMDRESNYDSARAEFILELVLTSLDTVLVLAALCFVPRPPALPSPARRRRTIQFLSIPLVLAVLLGINLAYHAALRGYVQFPEWMHAESELSLGWKIALVCVQPAVVEELFFRYLALGTLARVMSVPAAICVSSIMFGIAHSGVPLSVPILTMVGVGLGCARVWSGGLLVPMVIHGLHNGVVVYLESQA